MDSDYSWVPVLNTEVGNMKNKYEVTPAISVFPAGSFNNESIKPE